MSALIDPPLVTRESSIATSIDGTQSMTFDEYIHWREQFDQPEVCTF